MAQGPLQPIRPHFAQRGQFVPVVGGNVVVQIPGETVRIEVDDILTDNIITGIIISTVTGKSGGHNFKRADKIACKRALGPLGEFWELISTHEVEMREQAQKAAQQEVQRQQARAAQQEAQQARAAPPEPVEMPEPDEGEINVEEEDG
jgi:hypothetical protein